MAIKRVISTHELLSKKFSKVKLATPFTELFGTPSLRGSWFVGGDSGNGKTEFLLQLAYELSKVVKVNYNTIEEGWSPTYQEAVERNNLLRRGDRFQTLDMYSLEDLIKRLDKRNSPGAIFLDSIQFFRPNEDATRIINQIEYKNLKKRYPEKLFIWNSHMDGKQPSGSLAKFIRYDSDVKLRVEGYKAFPFPMSRYGGGEPYTIWPKGASEYWNE